MLGARSLDLVHLILGCELLAKGHVVIRGITATVIGSLSLGCSSCSNTILEIYWSLDWFPFVDVSEIVEGVSVVIDVSLELGFGWVS